MSDPISVFPVFVRNQVYPPSSVPVSGDTEAEYDVTLLEEELVAILEGELSCSLEGELQVAVEDEVLEVLLDDGDLRVELAEDVFEVELECEE